MWVVFFFQAEDGIRDLTVTGVQTCALPIWLQPAAAGSFFQPFTIAGDAPAATLAGVAGVEVRNVVALLPGRDPARRGEVVIVGAHYDHLGRGRFGTLDPDSTGRIHNGADDNASGTAALLEIARLLEARHTAPARTIVLVAFSGEELGTLGSSFFVQHAVPQPIDSLYAMLNLDMVGRLRSARLLALGSATAREFPALLDSLRSEERRVGKGGRFRWSPYH